MLICLSRCLNGLEVTIIPQLYEVMKALSDRTRFKIVQMLLVRDFCVGGLARTLGISEAAVSQHLKLLKDTGIISGVKEGYFMHYAVEREVLKGLAGALSGMVDMKREGAGECRPRSWETCALCNSKHPII
jgi:DNA-binding transcriptional ArsR family regulator